MSLLGEAIMTACNGLDPSLRRLNYEILGNTDRYLHAHVFPRYEWEDEELLTAPGLGLPARPLDLPARRLRRGARAPPRGHHQGTPPHHGRGHWRSGTLHRRRDRAHRSSARAGAPGPTRCSALSARRSDEA